MEEQIIFFRQAVDQGAIDLQENDNGNEVSTPPYHLYNGQIPVKVAKVIKPKKFQSSLLYEAFSLIYEVKDKTTTKQNLPIPTLLLRINDQHSCHSVCISHSPKCLSSAPWCKTMSNSIFEDNFN